jgi:Flp pilus assembly protein CpaB
VSKYLSTETMAVGILAIVVGLIGAYGVRSLLSKEPTPPPKGPEGIKVPMASIDLPANRVIAAGDITNMPTTRQKLQERNFPLEQVMMTPQQIIGRRLKTPMKQGDPFLTTSFYLAGTQPNLAELLKPGFRTFSIQLPDVRGGSVAAGTFVDVLFRAQERPGDEEVSPIPEMTVTLLRHVEVIAVEHPAPGTVASKESTVTLAVPEEKAADLQAVEGRGEFSLIARPPGESVALAAPAPGGVTLDDVLGIEPPVPPPPPFQTAIYRRGALQVNTFVDGQLVSSSGGRTVLPSGVGAARKKCKNCGKKGRVGPLTPVPAGKSRTPTLAPSKT